MGRRKKPENAELKASSSGADTWSPYDNRHSGLGSFLEDDVPYYDDDELPPYHDEHDENDEDDEDDEDDELEEDSDEFGELNFDGQLPPELFKPDRRRREARARGRRRRRR